MAQIGDGNSYGKPGIRQTEFMQGKTFSKIMKRAVGDATQRALTFF
jgi:hypothetical protein